jgi:hypothetical protein
MLTLKIYLDAETLPPEMNEQQLEDFKANIKAPANYKDEAKIEKWLEDNLEKKYRDLAKTSSTAHVATLAYGLNNKAIECAYTEDRNEKLILETFYSDIVAAIEYELDGEGGYDDSNHEILWVGYNCRKFDLDLLWKRAKVHGLNNLADLIPRSRFDKSVIDLMEVFQGPNTMDFVSQDKVCKYFGIEGKPDGIDGSKVYDFWMAGEYERIAEYNIDDVEKVKQLYQIMVG